MEIYNTEHHIYFIGLDGHDDLALAKRNLSVLRRAADDYVILYSQNDFRLNLSEFSLFHTEVTNRSIPSEAAFVQLIIEWLTESASYHYIATAGTEVVKTGNGQLKILNIILDTAMPSTITVYDNVEASGSIIWSMTLTASAEKVISVPLNVIFHIGLTIVSDQDDNITVSYF